MYDKANLIISAYCLQNGVTTKQLLNGKNTKTLRVLKRELREKLRNDTTLSWAEINTLTGRAESNRRP